MAALQLPSSRSPEAFARVLEVPEVEVTNLRSFRCGETKDVPGRNAPSVAGARRDSVAKDRFAVSGICNAGIEFLADWWRRVGWVR